MRKCIYFIVLLIIARPIMAQKDSLKFKNFRGFYFNTYFANYLGGSYSDYYMKFPHDGDEYYYDFKRYAYQMPAIGIGYVLNKHPFFIKTDINYWFGAKRLDEILISNWTIDDKYIGPPWPGSSPMPVGTRYYKNTDNIKGYINIHHLDLSFMVSGNITRNFRIYYGWRINFIANYSFNATMNRESSLYEVVAWTSQYTSRDSLIETGHQSFKNKEVKAKSIYGLSKKFFYDIGLCYNFRINKKLFIAEIQYEANPFPFRLSSGGGESYSCVTGKVSYVFKYSTYFGKKKSTVK